MTSMAIDRPLEATVDDIPDELFANLAPHGAPTASHVAPAGDVQDLLGALPELPSLRGYEERLSGIQTALDEAREEAASIRDELRRKADLLRKLALALEAV